MLTYDNTSLLQIQGRPKIQIVSEQTSESKFFTFEQTLQNRRDLVSIEDDAQIKPSKKKEIISYISNRDTLFIPIPEKPKKPIEINDKLIEERIIIPTNNIAIQSDDITYEHKQKVIYPHLAIYSSKSRKRRRCSN
jgi:hypothetical protein